MLGGRSASLRRGTSVFTALSSLSKPPASRIAVVLTRDKLCSTSKGWNCFLGSLFCTPGHLNEFWALLRKEHSRFGPSVTGKLLWLLSCVGQAQVV